VIVGNITLYKLTGLSNGTTYYLAISAMNSVGVESAKSTEISVKPVYDVAVPTITTFTATASPGLLTVAISLTATDNTGGTGVADYCIQETNSYAGCTWSGTIPTQYTFSTIGNKNLYAWARDGAENVSPVVSAATIITLADTIAPVITAFTMPTTASSLTVSVSTLTATDDVAVTGYLLTETASQPQADNPAWTASIPVSYTFATQGVKTLYAFAKDAAGNISVPLSASVTIVLPDTTAPTVTAFTLPVTATNLTVPVSTLTASDAVGVSGYLFSETASQPQANDPAWSATEPTSHTFATQGAKTLYAFAKDAAGNVSAPLSASVTISLPDTTAPAVTAFTIPATSTSLTVPVSSFTATDTVGVTGYLLNEIVTIPSVTDIHWTTTPTSSYTFANADAKTLYAWAKDAAGNVSAAVPAAVTITLPDTAAPTVNLFTLPTTATSLTIAVTALTATDDVAVTGFMLSESVTTPQADNPAWTSTPQTSYTLAAQGIRTAYAFAKDAAGNVSSPLSATVTVTLPDTTAPTVTAFAQPTAATSWTVPVSVFSATDNVAITGYFLSESITTPSAVDPGWTSTPPTVHTFSTVSSKTLYAFAKDAAGNISPPANASVTITLPDTTAPVISAFTLPTASAILIIPVSTLVGSDNVGIIGWCLAETNSATSCTWSATKPTAHTFNGGSGQRTLYAFAKDAAGNASIAVSAGINIALGDIGGGAAQNGGLPSIVDALDALRISVGAKIPTAAELARADVAPIINGIPQPDGKVDIHDVIVILRRVVGLPL
jgi:phage tail protein X